MINNYDPNFKGTHTIRVTFMQWDYVGHVAFTVGGNCRGATLLDSSFLDSDSQDDIDRYVENDCCFTLHEDDDTEEYYFTAILTNANGDELETDGDTEDFRSMIVRMEFVALQ